MYIYPLPLQYKYNRGSPGHGSPDCPAAPRAIRPWPRHSDGTADPVHARRRVAMSPTCAVLAGVRAAHVDRRRGGVSLVLEPALAEGVLVGVRRIAHGLWAKHPAVAPPVCLALGAASGRTTTVGVGAVGQAPGHRPRPSLPPRCAGAPLGPTSAGISREGASGAGWSFDHAVARGGGGDVLASVLLCQGTRTVRMARQAQAFVPRAAA